MADDRMAGLATGKGILFFAVPSIVLMVFISSYSIVDGVFVSNFIDTNALAAVNILMPAMSLFMAMGLLFASGGAALVNRKVGEGRIDEARGDFTLIILSAFVISMVVAVPCFIFLDDIVAALGANDTLHPYATAYARIVVLTCPIFVLQLVFNEFLIAVGRPTLSLVGTVVGGLGNLALDYLFIVPMGMGIEGAAWASVMGTAFPSIVGIAYFALDKDATIRFSHPSRSFAVISETATNGVSEMVSELSGAVTMFLFNIILMRLAGPDGVAAMAVANYAQFLALSVIIGYSQGVSPVMSYNYGADRKDVMQEIFKVSMSFCMAVSLVTFVILEVFTGTLVSMFSSSSQSVTDLAVSGIRIYSVAFLFAGFNLYSSALFTSLSNGKLSAVISFSRGFLVLVPALLALSYALGIDGVWTAVPVTEAVTIVLALYLVRRKAPEYGYAPHHAQVS